MDQDQLKAIEYFEVQFRKFANKPSIEELFSFAVKKIKNLKISDASFEKFQALEDCSI